MSFADQVTEGHAVVFFMDGAQVSRQMRTSEFGAFLDGYAGLSDLIETDVRAVYVVIGHDLFIRGLVFFRIYFDEEGRADSYWNLPVEDLARNGAKGPDLGGGAIHLVCRSQCPIAGIADELWDPDMTPGSNHFHTIRKAVEANRLKLKKTAAPTPDQDIPVLRSEREQTKTSSAGASETAGQRARRARLIRGQRLRIKTQRSAHQEELATMARDHRLNIQGLKADFLAFEQKYEHQHVLAQKLKKRLDKRDEELRALKEQRSQEADSRKQKIQTNDAELVLLREQLERKKRELALSSEKIQFLEQQNQELQNLEPSESSLLLQLRDQNLFLVAYHAGVGHLTLPYRDIERYYQSPNAYAAEKCGVSEEDYLQWLEHHGAPSCNQKLSNGSRCDEPVMRVSQPGDYQPGRDDRCEEHKVGEFQPA
ncbi:MAG: DNA repair protein [Oleiphilaceae bacterium]|nr:DNA repair protein [Oleiphilaceae bacterium]